MMAAIGSAEHSFSKNRISNPERIVFATIAIISISTFLACFWLIRHRPTIFSGNDPLGYYIYARSFVHDGDFDFSNELHFLKTPGRPVGAGVGALNPATHRFTNQYTLGLALLVSPFYFSVSKILSFAYPDGSLETFPWKLDQMIYSIGCLLLGLFGIWMAYKFVSLYFPPSISLLATALYWFCSPCLFYFGREPYQSHLGSIFAVSAFLYLWKVVSIPPLVRAFLLGVSAAAITLVRQQEILLVFTIFFFSYLFESKRYAVASIAKSVFLFVLGFFLIFWIQMAVWKSLWGAYFVFSYSPLGTFPYMFEPQILKVLFSSNHGLFTWHPILVFSIIGILISGRLTKFEKIAFVSAFLIQVYVVSSWFNWWMGHSFGNRAFLGLAPIFILGLAALIERIPAPRIKQVVIPIGIILFVFNGILVLGYLSEMIPYQGEFSWTRFLKQLPELPRHVLAKIENL